MNSENKKKILRERERERERKRMSIMRNDEVQAEIV